MLHQDRIVIVTGAASGIGRAAALRFATEGARVVLADLNAAGCEQLAGEINAAGGQALAHPTDVADEAAVGALVARTVEVFGGVDVLHNNAAALGPDMLGRDLDLLATPLQVWDTTFSVTLRGQFLCARAVVPHMLAAGRGSIVNMSSGTSLGGDRVRIAYSAAKAGVNALTRSIATMYGKEGIRCNAVSPGFVLTPPARVQVPPAQLAIYEDNCLTPHLGAPEDVAAVIVFVASDEARYMTGQVVVVDGGSFSHLGTLAAFRGQERATPPPG